MKTFPITDEKYTSLHGSFYNSHVLPKFEWGRKIYMQYDGKLCAAIPLYVAYVRPVKPTCPSDGVKDIVCFNIAGHGKKLMTYSIYMDGRKINGCFSNPKLFRTLEDYDRYIGGQYGCEYMPDAVSIDDIMRVHGYTSIREHACWESEIYGWYYRKSSGEVDKCPMNFKDLWIDEDGSHVTVVHETGWSGDKYPAYKTREECLAASRRPVVEFEDEELVPEEPELTAFEDRLAEIIYDAVGQCDSKVMDECCRQARKYSAELVGLAKEE